MTSETAPAKSLTDEDLESFEHLRISPGLLRLAGVERVNDQEAREKFGIRFDGDLNGIVFPYFLNGRRVTARLRRDHPEIVGGKVENKYICAKGDRRHLYLLPDSKPLLDDPRVPLLFVEAEKSVLAITEWSRRTGRKVLPLGSGGVWGWRGVVGVKTKSNGEREEEKAPLPEVAFAGAGRPCGILFDANAATNPKVRHARKALAERLEAQGAKVLVLELPVIDGVNGPDDYIAVQGDQAFDDLLNGKTTTPANATEKDLLSQSLNDYGNARRLIELYGCDLRYCTPMRKWLVWDGHRWKIDERDEAREHAHKTILEFARQALAGRNENLLRFAGSCLNSQRLTAALREAQPYLAVSPDELDSDPWLLNFQNGTMDLRTGELAEHRREHLITKIVHHDYDPEAQCPRFLVFVDRSAGPLVPYLQKACGYSVTGVTSEKVNFLCLGPTGTGKTTFLELFRHIFSEYSTLILIDALMQKEEDNNSRADLADLRGARFAMTSETEEGQRLREAKLKRISQGQGRIKSVRKYQNPIEFPETHKLWIDANHRPIVRGTDDAIWNRLAPISFPHPVPEPEIDRDLPRKLREEAEGIIAWTIEGARLWRKDGLGRPPEIEATRKEWREGMDRLGAFLETCCTKGSTLEVQARTLYKAYKAWAEEASDRPMNETMFGLRISEISGIKKDKSRKNVFYLGIGLQDLFHG